MGDWAKAALRRARERERSEAERRFSERARMHGAHQLKQLATADREERMRLRHEMGAREARQLNDALDDRRRRLAAILTEPARDQASYFQLLRAPVAGDDVDLDELGEAPVYEAPEPPSGLRRLSRRAWRDYEERSLQAQGDFARSLRSYWERHEEARTELAREQPGPGRSYVRVRQQHHQVDELRSAVRAGSAEALAEFVAVVALGTELPGGPTEGLRVAYEPRSHRVVIDYQLPALEVVPDVAECHYDDARERIETSAVPLPERHRDYLDLIGRLALRIVADLFAVDKHAQLDQIVFNGYMSKAAPDVASGNWLISLAATHDHDEHLDLRAVDFESSLAQLDARWVSREDLAQGIDPIVVTTECEAAEVVAIGIADGKAECDLLALPASELVAMTSELVSAMDLEVMTSDALDDDVVQCAARDQAGGDAQDVLVRLYRTERNVGVALMRSLASATEQHGATRAIAISTRGFTRGAVKHAEQASIELIESPELIDLLDERLRLAASIELAAERELTTV